MESPAVRLMIECRYKGKRYEFRNWRTNLASQNWLEQCGMCEWLYWRHGKGGAFRIGIAEHIQ